MTKKKLIIIGGVLAGFVSVVIVTSLYFSIMANALQAKSTPQAVNLEDYFVITNEIYADEYGQDLATKCVNLHFYDFDTLFSTLYGQYGELSCTPIEAIDGSMIYDYAFSSKCWRVELFTLVNDEPAQIASWISLVNLHDQSIAYESKPQVVRYRTQNLVTNLQVSSTGATHLFQMERDAFIDLLALIKSGGLDQEVGIPFDMANIPYQQTTTLPYPAT